MTQQHEREHWTLDRRVPISMIIAIAGHLGVSIWWASKLDSRVSAVEQTRVVQRERDALQDAANRESASQLRDQMVRIEIKLDRLIERGGNGNGTYGRP